MQQFIQSEKLTFHHNTTNDFEGRSEYKHFDTKNIRSSTFSLDRVEKEEKLISEFSQ